MGDADLLNGIASYHGCVPMVIIALVGVEVDLLEELLLMVLELSDHNERRQC